MVPLQGCNLETSLSLKNATAVHEYLNWHQKTVWFRQQKAVRTGMRGDDQQQNHILSYLLPEARVGKDHPLRAIRTLVDEVLA